MGERGQDFASSPPSSSKAAADAFAQDSENTTAADIPAPAAECNCNDTGICDQEDDDKPTTGRCFLRSFIRIAAVAALAGTLAWTAAFTVMATHTQVVRSKVYPALSSQYFPNKSGARVFTYLGVFYVVAGAIVLGWFWCFTATSATETRQARDGNVRGGTRYRQLMPRPTPWLVTPLRGGMYRHCNWSRLEILALVVGFLGVQAATIVTRAANKFYDDWLPTWNASKLWYEVAKTLGKTLAITLLVLFLPVAKHCFWSDAFNYQFERSIKFHRWLGWFFVATLIAHATCAVVALALAGQFKNCMWPSNRCINPQYQWGTWRSEESSRIITYGWTAALFAVLPMALTSLYQVRRRHFEWFYYTHFLFVPMIILAHLHYDGKATK